jgi:hypothetical protein
MEWKAVYKRLPFSAYYLTNVFSIPSYTVLPHFISSSSKISDWKRTPLITMSWLENSRVDDCLMFNFFHEVVNEIKLISKIRLPVIYLPYFHTYLDYDTMACNQQ